MRRRLRHAIVALIVVLLSTGALLVGRTLWRQRQVDLQAKLLDVLPEAAQRISDFKRTKVVNGRKVWEVSAAEAQYYDEEDMAVVHRPSVSFLLEDGREVALRGDEGRVFLAEQELEQVELRGDIRANFGEYSLQTDAATYERARNSIVAPGRVQIAGNEFDIRGDGMDIHLSSQRLRIDGNVRMVLRPEE